MTSLALSSQASTDMAESLKELVVQTQGSAVHLSSSITELAATSKAATGNGYRNRSDHY